MSLAPSTHLYRFSPDVVATRIDERILDDHGLFTNVVQAGVSTVLGLVVKAAPGILDAIQKKYDKPTKAESDPLLAYARGLDKRRVFYFPYDVECEVMCISSLDEVRRFTDETLAETEVERCPHTATPLGPPRVQRHAPGDMKAIDNFFQERVEILGIRTTRRWPGPA